MPTYVEVTEGVRAAIAAYTHALDDGRAHDVVATFCADGGCDIPGLGTYRGREELLAAYEGWTPKVPVRHLITNTLVTDWSDAEAHATSDVTVLVKGIDGWRIEVVGRYTDTLHRDGDRWRFHHRTASFL